MKTTNILLFIFSPIWMFVMVFGSFSVGFFAYWFIFIYPSKSPDEFDEDNETQETKNTNRNTKSHIIANDNKTKQTNNNYDRHNNKNQNNSYKITIIHKFPKTSVINHNRKYYHNHSNNNTHRAYKRRNLAIRYPINKKHKNLHYNKKRTAK